MSRDPVPFGTCRFLFPLSLSALTHCGGREGGGVQGLLKLKFLPSLAYPELSTLNSHH